MSNQSISAKELDRIFDEGEEDIIEYLDLSTVCRPGLEVRKVNVDMPEWMINRLDQEAKRLGISRQSVVITWLSEKLDETSDTINNF